MDETIGTIVMALIIVVPILPSIILTFLSALAFTRNWKFLYYNFSFASVCNVILLISFLLSYLYASRGQDAREGWVLFWGMPVLGLIFSVGSFLLGFVGYKFNSSSEDEQALPWYPFWASVTAIVGFPLLWLVILITPF